MLYMSSPPPECKILFLYTEADLPGPLPSIEAIEANPDFTNKFPSWFIFIGNHFFVKYGTAIEPLEAENMMFVRQQAKLPVPRVFGVYQRQLAPCEAITYIVMGRIEGGSLDRVWNNLNAEQRLQISHQLKDTFARLPAVPHQGFFGSLDRTKLRDFLFTVGENTKQITWPGDTEEELLECFVTSIRARRPNSPQGMAKYMQDLFLKVYKGSGSAVFTHGDLQMRNILVQPDGSITIIDWAMSGWYPTYWEYVAAISGFDSSFTRPLDDWCTFLVSFLEEFPNHLAWTHVIRKSKYF
ncbi:hypothetical protein NLG97_g2862 [Lecanicillium saksenae]|uniref:Uncharacterized protein n=1 Tax=Lecanicillium saksenae TaxID=468837 RepID=A0ACC1R1F9_9HYPO|nr:hypothetical protein NLG97_g2862 [Lecanicillium saksenae]